MSALTLFQCVCIHVSLSCSVGNVGYIHQLLLGTGMFKNSLCYENGFFCILTVYVRKKRSLVFRIFLSLIWRILFSYYVVASRHWMSHPE